MKITVDENICIGCGTCEVMCQIVLQLKTGFQKLRKQMVAKAVMSKKWLMPAQ